MDGFTAMTHEWANFFAALAQVSGALVGLVFVALTFNAKKLGIGGDPMLAALARQTFADFLLLLLVSMVMLTPHVPAVNVGLMFLVFIGVGVLRIIYSLVQLRAHLRRWAILQRFVLSAIGQAMLGWAAVTMVTGLGKPGVTGSLLFAGVLPLMLSGCRSAWLLVMHGEDLAA